MSGRKQSRANGNQRIASRHRAPATPAPGLAGSPLEAMRLDGGALLAAGGLLGLGVVMSYSSTAPLALDQLLPPLFVEHMGALAIGLAAATAAMLMPLHVLRALALPAWLVAVALLVANHLIGIEVNGATRWLPVPGLSIRFQPVEIAKLATLLAVFAVVAHHPRPREL